MQNNTYVQSLASATPPAVMAKVASLSGMSGLNEELMMRYRFTEIEYYISSTIITAAVSCRGQYWNIICSHVVRLVLCFTMPHCSWHKLCMQCQRYQQWSCPLFQAATSSFNRH